jgi:hypothetical protein
MSHTAAINTITTDVHNPVVPANPHTHCDCGACDLEVLALAEAHDQSIEAQTNILAQHWA